VRIFWGKRAEEENRYTVRRSIKKIERIRTKKENTHTVRSVERESLKDIQRDTEIIQSTIRNCFFLFVIWVFSCLTR